jgi:hypothetical protein
MAGSYNQIITEQGDLVSAKAFIEQIKNLGDAYEMTEEMYGMIWWLAHMSQDSPAMLPEEMVEMARQNYAQGLLLAWENQRKMKNHGR